MNPTENHGEVMSTEEWMSIIGGNEISQGKMNQLIMNYLVTEGFQEAAEKFREESGLAPGEDLLASVPVLKIWHAILNGKVQEATTLIKQHYPALFDNDRRLYLHLQQQQLIELIRDNNIEESIIFAQNHLKEAGVDDDTILRDLERTVALLAFEDPANSSFGDLMTHAHRLRVANEVKAAIMKMDHKDTATPKMSVLLKLVQWAQDKMTKNNVKQPEMTDLAAATIEDPE